MVVGLLPPSSGEVIIDGVSMSDPGQAQARQKLRRRIQMIFQDPYASLNPRFRVDAIVAEPIRAFDLIQGERNIKARVGELLEPGRPAPRRRLEISARIFRRPAPAHRDRPRAGLEAEFIVCDEPTSALDVSVQAQILNLMRDLQDKFGLTYLFISHNLAVVAPHGDPHRRDVSRPHRRDRATGASCSATRACPTPACCWTRCPISRCPAASGSRSRARSPTRSIRRPAAPSTRAARWRSISAAGRRPPDRRRRLPRRQPARCAAALA